MTDKTQFIPVITTESKLNERAVKRPGHLYFTADAGKMYLDIDANTRISVGGTGAGASIFYTDSDKIIQNGLGDFIITKSMLTNPTAYCEKEDLIINSDGTFYKVERVQNESFYCSILSTNNGASIWYINSEPLEQQTDDYFYIESDLFVTKNANCVENDLIINIVDGNFYRVEDIVDGIFRCVLMAMAGEGSGNIVKRGSFSVDVIGETTVLNGSSCSFMINATSGTENEVPLDPSKGDIKVKVEYYEGTDTRPYFTETVNDLEAGIPYPYSTKNHLRDSKTVRIVFTPTGNSAFSPSSSTKQIISSSLDIKWASSFKNTSYFDPNNNKPLEVSVNTSTGADRIYDLYFDEYLVRTQTVTSGAEPTRYTINENSIILNEDGTSTGQNLGELFSHGSHIIKARISFKNSRGERGNSTDFIQKEVAILRDSRPLIWLDEFQESYYEYESVFAQFRVYDPQSTDGKVQVYLYKNNADVLDGGYKTVSNNDSNWAQWELTDLSATEKTFYTIRVGFGEREVRRNFELNVLKDPREMESNSAIKRANLSFSAKGRSNADSNKKTLMIGDKKSILTGFNWYNNGWITENRATSLKVSNGAKAQLPIGSMLFGSQRNNTIEIRMKISNIQDYSTLITNYTRYCVKNGDEITWTDNALFDAFKAQRNSIGGFSSYDAYLTHQIPILREAEIAASETGTATTPEYDSLSFWKIDRDYNLNNAIITFKGDDADVSKEPAICFGPQDGFFSNGTDSVSVNFVEDEIINLTIVSNGGESTVGDDNLMKIYLNGMLTSLARSTKSLDAATGVETTWAIGNTDGKETYLTITSNVCDIDIYSIRIYNVALDVSEVLLNYCYDNNNPKEWDLTKLATNIEGKFQFSYDLMKEYNAKAFESSSGDNIVMPYIVFTTDKGDISESNLPWFKTESEDTGVSHYEKVSMEFVNTPLDLAYSRGLLTEAAKEEGYVDTLDKNGNVTTTAVQNYYLHHCPSWKGDNVDLGVQGTSSEFYPRRNYKAKTKVAVNVKDGNNNKVEYVKAVFGYDTATSYNADQVYYYANEDGKMVTFEGEPYSLATSYDPNASYWYVTHKGAFKQPGDEAKFLINSAEDFNKGPLALWIDLDVDSKIKILCTDAMITAYNAAHGTSISNPTTSDATTALSAEEIEKYAGHWLIKNENAVLHLTENEYNEAPAVVAAAKNAAPAISDTNSPYYGHWYVERAITVEQNVTTDEYEMIPHQGPFKEEYDAMKVDNTEPRRLKFFYYDNKDVGTNKFTLKIDFMESSGSYNMGLANLIYDAYSDHPLSNYSEAFDGAVINDVTSFRTSVQGFPTLAFHQTREREANNLPPVFIGRYNMLLDKGANEAYGFKLSGKQKFNGNKNISETAECWEFENNNRGWCSFRDPWNRKELSFAPPAAASNAYNASGAPTIVDSFEYRYNSDDDYIDLLTHLNNSAGTDSARVALFNKYGIDVGDPVNGLKAGREQIYKIYGNWEKAVKWVWSTATDASIQFDGEPAPIEVPSLGRYDEIELATKYEPGVYYYKTTDDIYIPYSRTELDGTKLFKKYITVDSEGKTSETYSPIRLTLDESKMYKPNVYYTLVNKNYILSTSETIDELATYYKLTENYVPVEFTEEMPYEREKYYVLTEGEYRRCTDSEPVPGVTYFKSTLKDEYWKLPVEVKMSGRYYNYDTKEYRLAKFKEELRKHFNFEYLVTYFVITEILECYDSRGKNCMMASWGPQEAGGDYIWYPIFYDLDTQLGINNTGIPSFGYDIDATEEGSFSTNDSVLWNNLYSLFKTQISLKYQQLRGTAVADFKGNRTDTVGKLVRSPFSTVDRIEDYYSCNPDLYNSYSMRGQRPLIALNCDEQYKYIEITDSQNGKFKITSDGKVAQAPVIAGYLGSSTGLPLWQADSTDTYFYALQGNRSMSRRQFLTNRLNYINSWLNIGNYARAGQNRIRSRVSANSSMNTSDKWIEGTAFNGDTGLTSSPYFKKDENGRDTDVKNHMFDGEYWITMTPARNMYVTVGTDAANFPSLKYSGTPVKFKTADLETGVRSSGNYREQLYYIYGLDQMKSLGDLSKLYFQEFALEGSISKLVDLKLGYDGLDEEGNEYLNDKVNDWTIPGGASSAQGGMPLLKEMNLSNIKFKNESKVIDLTSCTKLQNFRAYGSNITGVNFAPGVALDTLHLSETVKSLNLVEANMLENLIETYQPPQLNASSGNLEALKGLYVKNLTDVNLNEVTNSKPETDISNLTIQGGGLKYNSYTLLRKFYKSSVDANSTTKRFVNLSNVQWAPYQEVETSAVFDSSAKYFVDNGHFGLVNFDSSIHNWSQLVADKKMYIKDEEYVGEPIKEEGIQLLKNLITNNYFFGISEQTNPNITGIIYIDNDTVLDEGEIQSELQIKYPNLTFFFSNVGAGYSARFVIKTESAEILIGTDKLGANGKIKDEDGSEREYFKNPVERSESEFDMGRIDSRIATQDFLGWSLSNNPKDTLIESYDVNLNLRGESDRIRHTWKDLKLDKDQHDYTFYAVFDDHFYNITFHADNDSYIHPVKLNNIIGQNMPKASEWLPYRDDSTLVGEDEDKTWRLKHWAAIENGPKVDLNNYVANGDYHFYAVFEKVSVYDYPSDGVEYLEYLDAFGKVESYYVKAINGVILKGKITLRNTYNGLPVSRVGANNIPGFMNQTEITHVFFQERGSNYEAFKGQAFNGCSKLRKIEYPINLKTMENNIFSSVNGLEFCDLSVLKSLEEIGGSAYNHAFANKNETLSLQLPGSLKTIRSNAFGYPGFTDCHVSIVIGALGEPSQLSFVSNDAFECPGNIISQVEIYCTAADRNDSNKPYFTEQYWRDTYRVENVSIITT